jgi:translation initiation factor 2 subunit 1
MSDSNRFYEEKFPEIDQLVMVLVKRVVQGVGAYVELLEYGNVEGMIQLSELSKRRIRSISKLIRVGRTEAVSVLRVDPEKGYIDLSKKRVEQSDQNELETKYAMSKTVHSIMRHVASNTEMPVEEVCEKIAWPLYKKHEHAYEGLKKSVAEPETLQFLNLPEDVMKALLEGVKRRLTPSKLSVRAKIEVTCNEYEGIEAIKRALTKGIEFSTAEHKVQIKLIAPPQYSVLVHDVEKELGLELVQKAIVAVGEHIKTEGGLMAVKQEAEVCGDVEEIVTGPGGDDSGSDGSSDEDQDESMGFGLTEEEIAKQTGAA